MTSDISVHFEKARASLKAEHDSMVQKVKDEIKAGKQKALSKV
jgi:hypothetical protein